MRPRRAATGVRAEPRRQSAPSRHRSPLPVATGVLWGGEVFAAPGVDQPTLPYQTLLVQILSSFTTSPVFGECQILPLPA